MEPNESSQAWRALYHGPVALYSYTARAYTAALYSIQPIHYTALYADPLTYTYSSPLEQPGPRAPPELISAE